MAAGTTVQITMPQMGESVTEGTILEWLKQEGDPVEADEGIVEVSTDKVDAEVPAPASGVLAKILVGPDETVPTGAVLGEIQVNGGGPSSGNGGAPDLATTPTATGGRDPDFASDESAVEEAEHGAAAEVEHQWTAEDADGGGRSAEGAQGERAPSLVDVTLPEMGESVTEGTVLEWLKQVGEEVEADEGLVEISTDKVDAEVPAPVPGTLTEILVQPDDTVTPGTVLCRLAPAASERTPAGEPAAAQPERGRVVAEPRPAPDGGNGAANATPVAARIAGANGLALDAIEGSGPRGRVTKADVLAALESNGGSGAAATARPAPADSAAEPPPHPAALSGERTATPIRGPAATLARFMEQSRSIPTATSFRTLEVDTLDARRRALKDAGRKLSFTHLVAWAIVRAAAEMPVMAHAFEERDGKPHRVDPGEVSLGLAVDVERPDGSRSLVVPVVHRADTLDFPAFVERYDELVAGARDNSLPPDAYSGANITLTNPGGIGTVASVPRLMPGQGTIVATGAIGLPPGLRTADPVRVR
ncbi:MAG: 2-oxo acid dehydrogenase subunit E2, partial [Actinobacteria bacterium]|nr:2-oxo acid dehydrogenase subunit E2 [Actinomycetota bacterium]